MMQCSMKVNFFLRSSIDFLDEDEESDNPEDNNEFSFPENSGKYFFNSSMMIDTNDDMPEHYRHIRYGLHSVILHYHAHIEI